MPRILPFLAICLSLSACTIFKSVPQPRTEFRGFWVATVVNIDWPKKGSDSAQKQKEDYLQILDFYQNLNFNVAIVQIRTAGDAFYKSTQAPWSRFLTGSEGNVSEAKSELLSWMINETHKRGMEFHAWLNPYRATFDLNTALLSDEHDFNRHPDWMIKYGKKYYYDPGQPEVQKKMLAVIDEVVAGYDIDAIHFDDYFYPYTLQGETFNDSISFYNCALPDQDLNDWRRSNIDSLIKNSHEIIKARKPWVQFGVSPFGVWKNIATDPNGSDTRAGQTTFDNLYADPLLWMKEGWLDYIIPQVYWSMELPVASHRKLVDWWSKNSTNTNLYVGNGPYKIRNNSDTAWNDKTELPNQINYARTKSAVSGNAFFSAKSLINDHQDVVRLLKRKVYRQKALVPVAPEATKASRTFIEPLSIRRTSSALALKFNPSEKVRFVMAYRSGKKEKETYAIKKLVLQQAVGADKQVEIPIDKLKKSKTVALTFIDLYGRETKPIIVHLNKTN